MKLERSAGILLHITSLPGEFGIGDLGESAYGFVDFLQRSGQSVWQVLPLSPSGAGDSPYSSYSAFAGNPLLISLATLVDRQLLLPEQMEELREESRQHAAATESGDSRTDYELAKAIKPKGLKWAFENFLKRAQCAQFDEFESFCTRQKWWLDDFAFFAALMKHFQTDDWTRWDAELVSRQPDAMGHWKQKLAREIEFEQFCQFIFFRQWDSLHSYAKQHEVALFGDMPIFVAFGSADVWANQSLFCLDSKGRPTFVAGVPPDYFSKTGQLWGNPLYHWENVQRSGYRWWIQRLKAAFELYDILRIDHFRGFESYWSVPAGAKTAVSGKWEKGPGTGPFDAARRELGELQIVAEDLGLITDEVHALREELQFPGMRVLQFGFDQEHDVYHRPDHFPEGSVAYTGTHDNSTIVGWYLQRQESKSEEDILDRYLGDVLPSESIQWRLLSMLYSSQAILAIAPMQDVLGLDNSAKMNTPGVPNGNWGWRLDEQALTDGVAQKLLSLMQTHHRLVSNS